MTALLTAILVSFSPPAQAPEPLTLEAIIQVERAYNSTDSLEAQFEQRYHSKVFDVVDSPRVKFGLLDLD